LLWKEPQWEGYQMVIISPVWVSNLWSTRWIRLVFLRFFVHWFIVLSAWVSPVYTKYVSMAVHSVEFPQKKQFLKKPGFLLSALIILDWYPYVSLFPDLLCYRLQCHRFTQNTFRRLYTPSNFHKKSVHKETRIPTVCVDNFRLG